MSTPDLVAAVADGSYVFIGVIVVILLAVAYGYYTIRGSGINKHPSDGGAGAPGSAGPSEASGQGRSTGNTSEGRGAGDTFSDHGTG